MEPNTPTPADFIAILKRRKWSLTLSAMVIFLLSLAIALSLPPIYRSSATILIEEQEIPSDFVMATVTSYVEQRLQSINQRIMSTSNLMEIINRFGLYKDLRDKRTTEEIIKKMREAVQLKPISAEVMDHRTGRATAATIAFTLSYEGKESPQTVQRVATTLTSLFLEENLKVRQRQTRETSTFLENETDRVKAELEAIEAKVAEFKEAHLNEIPELLQLNIRSLDDIERNLERLQEQLRSLKQTEGYLQSQLADLSPQTEIDSSKNRLEELELQMAYLETRYSDQYPDVVKTRAEIAEIEKRLEEKASETDKDQPGNPAYVTLSAQLAATRADIRSIRAQIHDFEEKKLTYRQRIDVFPMVEREYKTLMLERNNLNAKFEDLMRKYMEARVAQGLETEQKGERFTLIDPARLPEKPFKPNRRAILLVGLVLALGAGVGLSALREFCDDAVHKADDLSLALDVPVLAGIPIIMTREDILRKKKKRIFGIIASVIIIVGGLTIFHYYIMDFDVFWARVLRRLAI